MEKEVKTTLRNNLLEICEQYKTMSESEIYSSIGWCVYSAEEDIDIDTECYIDDYPNFDDDDNELPLAFVEQNGLKFCFSDENILDVVGACLHQKRDASVEELMQSLEYYMEKDTFLEL